MWTNQKQGLLSGRSLNPTTLQRYVTLFSNTTVFIYKERKKNNDVCVSATRSQQLCVKLEPRGLLYVKLSLQEKWDTQVDESRPCSLLQYYYSNQVTLSADASQPISSSSGPTNVFGVELHHLVEKEESTVPIPLLIQKCVKEIEVRGLRVRRIISA